MRAGILFAACAVAFEVARDPVNCAQSSVERSSFHARSGLSFARRTAHHRAGAGARAVVRRSHHRGTPLRDLRLGFAHGRYAWAGHGHGAAACRYRDGSRVLRGSRRRRQGRGRLSPRRPGYGNALHQLRTLRRVRIGSRLPLRERGLLGAWRGTRRFCRVHAGRGCRDAAPARWRRRRMRCTRRAVCRCPARHQCGTPRPRRARADHGWRADWARLRGVGAVLRRARRRSIRLRSRTSRACRTPRCNRDHRCEKGECRRRFQTPCRPAARRDHRMRRLAWHATTRDGLRTDGRTHRRIGRVHGAGSHPAGEGADERAADQLCVYVPASGV